MKFTVYCYLVFLLASSAAQATEAPYELQWVSQLGTGNNDSSSSVAIDGSGNAYISGGTGGSLGGTNAGSSDAFLAKYDSSGALLWTRQIGTTDWDWSNSVAVDGYGNAYISGTTGGSIGGQNAGGFDAFLAKYDSSGALLWTRQLGTSDWDISNSVAIDGSGNAYISGWTDGSIGGPNAGGPDAFLAKYDSSGSLLWTRQLGTSSSDVSSSVAIDGSGTGNTYISGQTLGSLGGPNPSGNSFAFLAKYDNSGELLWTRQLGTGMGDISLSVASDRSGNAYISGYTKGNISGLNAGGDDAFLAKYDGSGALLWTRQLGTSTHDWSYSVAIDDSGNAYITGWTDGNIGGPNDGGHDAFLAKYDPSGTLLWTRQMGTSNHDFGMSVAIDGENAYISGETWGSLGGPNAGYTDAFLAKYSPIPEPGTIALIVPALLGFAGMAWRRTRK